MFVVRRGFHLMRMTTTLQDQGNLKSPGGFLALLQPLFRCTGVSLTLLESICAPGTGSVFFDCRALALLVACDDVRVMTYVVAEIMVTAEWQIQGELALCVTHSS